MATSPRVRGKGNVIFSLKNGTPAAVNYGDDLQRVSKSSDDADDSNVTFYDVSQGATKVYAYVITGVVSYAPGSLFMLLMNNPGAEFALTYAPEGNASPSSTKPHETSTVRATGKPVYDLEANLDANYAATFEYTFNVVGDTTLVTA